ncbi:MAG: tetratricopeptide repeat protein [Bryobacteraceae bacterium]
MVVSQYRRRPVLRTAFFFFVPLWLAWAQGDQLAEQSRRGKELMAQGRFEDAIGVYRDMVKAVPGNSGLVLNLALAEQMAGHPDQAIPHFETVLKAEPNSIPALTSMGMARLQLNQPTQALAPLNKVVTLQPNNVNARGMLAGAEISLGRFAEAAAQYRSLTKLAPDDAKAWYGLGKAYEELATARFNELTSMGPQSGYVASLVADSRVQRRQYRSAFFFYKEAEKRTPDLPGLHAGVARVYRETGHPEWAAAEEKLEADSDCKVQTQACRFLRGDYLGATKAGSKTEASLFWAARAYNQMAIDSFGKLGQLPDSPEVHALKAQIFHDHGQDLEAAKEWRAAIAISRDPNDPRLKAELANALFLARDYQAAMPLIQQFLVSDPDAADFNFMMGESLWRTQQAEKALPYLERALKSSPQMLPAHAAMGLALVSLGRNNEAVPHLEQAASLDDDGSLHYSLARAYQSTGDKERASRSLEQYNKIKKRNAEVNEDLAKEAEITAPATLAPGR